MIAKLLAGSGFRRRSYDDQEGDKDINNILQPSDLHDIEKRARFNNSSAFGLRTKTNLSSSSTADLKLANCILDQDYNSTVRLFLMKSALRWNFNSFTFDALCCGRSLTELLLHLFDYYDLYNIFKLDFLKVLKCFRLLEFGYHSTNPYHNSIHAADVTQAMHCFIQENKIRKHMTHLETLCSILAAVCHDLDHPGVNQSFLAATNNPLASLYNNNSVLENHHWRFALCIFRESQLFDHFTDDIFNEMATQLKHLILATDIARQNEYLKRFKDLTESCGFSMQNTDDRALVLQMALKCADLGNPCRPWLISRVWSNLICDEFYKMGRIERQLGIPLTPICQREKTSIAGIQTDFFRFIVLPLLELWHKFLSSPLSSLLMSNFEHNYQRWQRANRIVQQLRRRKSVACLEPVEDSAEPEDKLNSGISFGFFSNKSFAAIKRASSDYVKSGNGSLELLRDFQLNRAIEKSPIICRARTKLLKKSQCAASTSTFNDDSSSKQLQGCSITKHHTSHQKHDCSDSKGDSRTLEQQQQQHNLKSRCAQSSHSSSRNLPMSSNYRKALSPIEDGDAPSPDQQQQQNKPQPQQRIPPFSCSGQTTTTTSALPASSQLYDSSSASSSSPSRASSACSSPVIQRSMSSRTSIDQLVGNSAIHLQHIRQQQPQQHHSRTKHHHHPFLAQQYYESPASGTKLRPPNLPNARQSTPSSSSQSKSLYKSRRRESDPGCCTNKYELAAAIVLIQFQNNSIYHQRRSSLPVCVPKRRSSK